MDENQSDLVRFLALVLEIARLVNESDGYSDPLDFLFIPLLSPNFTPAQPLSIFVYDSFLSVKHITNNKTSNTKNTNRKSQKLSLTKLVAIASIHGCCSCHHRSAQSPSSCFKFSWLVCICLF